VRFIIAVCDIVDVSKMANEVIILPLDTVKKMFTSTKEVKSHAAFVCLSVCLSVMPWF